MMACFEGLRYLATVSSFKLSARMICRPNPPLRPYALIASQVPTQRWLIRPHELNHRARSENELVHLRLWLVFNRPLTLKPLYIR
jgi:hypothetical protein